MLYIGDNFWFQKMGNQLTGIAPSQILPVEHYLQDISEYEYDVSLGSTRFFKVQAFWPFTYYVILLNTNKPPSLAKYHKMPLPFKYLPKKNP